MAKLTDAIIEHIFKNLGLYNHQVPVSICHDIFLTKEQISFFLEKELFAPVWACQTSINDKKLSIICTSFGYDERFVVVKLDGNPAYGLYLDYDAHDKYVNGFIATEIKSKAWIPTTIFLQATFLAGMEQLKDLTSKYDKASGLEELFLLLKEFIAYREAMNGDTE